MIYQITFKKSAIKDLLSLPAEEVRRIINKIDQLAFDPRPKGCKKLQGDNLDLWRIRIGNYRVDIYHRRSQKRYLLKSF